MRRFPGCAAAALASALLLAGPASANGRFPASSAVAFDPHDSKTLYVRATFGLLATHDGGDSWHWVCEKAIGFSGMEDPTYVVTPKGTLVGGTFSGIAVSRDGGCDFSFSGGPNAHIVSDIAMRPDGELVGITSVHAQGATYDNHVLVSKDDGQTFTATGGPIDPKLLIESIEVTPSDPTRLYLSAVQGEGAARTASLHVSYDTALSWVERKFELLEGETAPFIALVDPKNADRIYVRTAAPVDHSSRLVVSDDAGKTWKKVYEAGTPILGFALSEDGSRLFAGSREGVISAATDTFAITKGATNEIQCLGLSSKVLWACSTERSGFFVGTSRGGGRGFDAKLHLDELKGPLECGPETSVAKQCTDEWPKLRRELGIPDPGEKHNVGPAGPALKGRGVQTKRASSPIRAFAGIALVGMAAYYALKRLRRNR